MKNEIKFLKNSLEHNEIRYISIYYKGRELSRMTDIFYENIENNAFVFGFSDIKTKYIISFDEIQNVFLLPLPTKIIIVLDKLDIEIYLTE